MEKLRDRKIGVWVFKYSKWYVAYSLHSEGNFGLREEVLDDWMVYERCISVGCYSLSKKEAISVCENIKGFRYNKIENARKRLEGLVKKFNPS